MLTIQDVHINRASPISVHDQLTKQLELLIRLGSFQPCAPLPSIKVLAAQLGINHNTVYKAYLALTKEGWVKASRGKATSVVDHVVYLDRKVVEKLQSIAHGDIDPLYLAAYEALTINGHGL